MNEGHAALCSSPEWAAHIAEVVLPEALGGVPLDGEVLEIGPGYGATTEHLARVAPRLTVVELDERLVADLREQFPAVSVVHGNGADLPFEAGRFDAVVCFTMLHHMPSVRAQDALFGEARRVLVAGGVFAGSDSVASPRLREFHAGDVYVPVDPATLPTRLSRAGFTRIEVRVPVPGERLMFRALVP